MSTSTRLFDPGEAFPDFDPEGWESFEKRTISGEEWARGWFNETHQVLARIAPSGFLHLSIKRRDKSPIRDWRELQWVKNEIAGKHTEAVELFPSESRLVDTSNQYHLFCLPPGEHFPFGYQGRGVADENAARWFGARQEPWPEERTPPDLLTLKDAKRVTEHQVLIEALKAVLETDKGDPRRHRKALDYAHRLMRSFERRGQG